MRRVAWWCGCLALGISSMAVAEATPEQIAQAIRDLGDRSFPVREKATRFLWQAGEAAEPALQRALLGGDPEVVRRAASILERFDRGEHPDTPKPVVELLHRYRDANQATRLEVLSQLVEQGKPGLRALRRLARNRDHKADRLLIQSLIVQQAPRQTARMILAGDAAGAEEWLEFCLAVPGAATFDDYAAVIYLRKDVDRAIRFWHSETPGPARARALAHLHCMNRNWEQAKPWLNEAGIALLSDRSHLLRGEWMNLQCVSIAAKRSEVSLEHRCMLMAARRLSGDSSRFEVLLSQLVAEAKKSPVAAALLAETLMQLGDLSTIEEHLLGVSGAEPILFDALAKRKGEKAAIDWARGLKLSDKTTQHLLELRLASRLYLLQADDDARQISDKWLASRRHPADWPQALQWTTSLMAVGRRDVATRHAAIMLEVLRRSEQDEGAGDFFEALFGPDASIAEAWWHYLCVAQGGEAPTVMSLVHRILSGENQPRLVNWARDLANTAANAHAEDVAPERRERALIGPLAAAEALRRAGLDDLAEANYREAMKALPSASALRFSAFLQAKRRFAEAAAALELACHKTPDDPVLQFFRGRAAMLAGRTADGERLQKLAHWLPLANLAPRWRLLRELQLHGLDDAARREADIAVAVGDPFDKYYPVFLPLAADAALKRGDHAEAGRLYRQAQALTLLRPSENEPTIPDGSLALQIDRCRLLGLAAADENAGFSRELESTLVRIGDGAELLNLILPSLAKAKKHSAMNESADKVLRRLDSRCREFPASTWAANEYAWFAALIGKNLDAALERARMAVAREPGNAAYHDTLAEVHFQRGEREQALTHNRTCRKLQANRTYYQRQYDRFSKGDTQTPPTLP